MTMGERKIWTRENEIIAYALYCVTPLNKINISNKMIQQCAEICDKSVSSMVAKMQNYRYLDPLVNKNVKGLSHYSKLSKKIFEEFQNDWGELSYTAENLTGLEIFNGTPEKGAKPISSLNDRIKTNRERQFFRASLFAAYNGQCCITGMSIPQLLAASHIKPYSKCRTSSERTDPHNGLLLNNIYDTAFDKGFITITKDLKIWVSDYVKANAKDAFTKQILVDIEGSRITRSKTFLPAPKFLEYHNDVIFKGGTL